MTRVTAFAIAALALFGLAACETIEGAGRDIEDTGEAITDASQNAQ